MKQLLYHQPEELQAIPHLITKRFIQRALFKLNDKNQLISLVTPACSPQLLDKLIQDEVTKYYNQEVNNANES